MFRRCFLTVLAWSVMLPSLLAAQETAPVAPRSADEATAAAVQPKPPAKADSKESESIREQTIYIPYSKLKKVFEQQGRGVFVPYEKFQQLWEQAQRNQPRPVQHRPPAGALITSISNEALVRSEVVEVDATLTIEQLSVGWHQIPLRLQGAAILKATVGDQQARILFRKDQGYYLLLEHQEDGAKQIELKLKYAKAIQKEPGQNTAVFQPPQAPVNRWRIRVPETGVKVNVSPTIAASEEKRPAGDAEPEQPGTDETIVQAFVGAAPEVRIQWTPKSKGATGLTALATASVSEEVVIDQGAVRTRATIQVSISRAELTRLQLRVPLEHKVVGVFDANVRQWGVERDEKEQLVTIELFEAAASRQQIVLQLERFREDKSPEVVAVPRIALDNMSRQEGFVLVKLASELRAESTERQGLLQVDQSELAVPAPSNKWDFAYRYASLPYELKLRIERVLPQIHAHQVVETYFEPERLTMSSVVEFDVQRAGVFQLEMTVPPGWQLVRVEGRPVGKRPAVAVNTHHLEGEGENRTLIVNLARKATGKVGLLLELERTLDAPDLLTPTGKIFALSIQVPRVGGDYLQRQTGSLILHTPESLRVNVDKQSGLRPVSSAAARGSVPSPLKSRFTELRELLAFTFADDAIQLSLQAERRKPHVTVRQLLSVEIEPGVLKYAARFHFDIRYSGVKSVRIDVPIALADKIRDDDPSITRSVIEPAPENLAEGYVAWRFTGESEFNKAVDFALQWEENISSLEVGKSHQFALPNLVVQDVDRSWGQIVVAKAENLDVQPIGQPEGLRPIDPQQDLASANPLPNAARAFEFQGEWTLELKATRYELEDVKRTNIEQAVIRMVVTRHGETAVQAIYRIRSARQRIAIQLPPEVELDASPLRINGAVVALEKGDDDEHFIPLAGNDISNSVLVELRYTTNRDQSRLDVPLFPDDPATQKVYLCIFLPRELALLNHSGPWSDELRSDWQSVFYNVIGTDRSDEELIRDLIRGVPGNLSVSEFPRSGRLMVYSTLQPGGPPDGSLRLKSISQNTVNALLFAIVGLVGVGFYWQSIPRKFLALGALFVAAILSGVFAPTFSRQLLSVYLFIAVGAMLLVWTMRHLGLLVKYWTQALQRSDQGRLALASAADVSDSQASAPAPVNASVASKEGSADSSDDDSGDTVPGNQA